MSNNGDRPVLNVNSDGAYDTSPTRDIIPDQQKDLLNMRNDLNEMQKKLNAKFSHLDEIETASKRM